MAKCMDVQAKEEEEGKRRETEDEKTGNGLLEKFGGHLSAPPHLVTYKYMLSIHGRKQTAKYFHVPSSQVNTRRF
jgi:hypothetical protein